MFSPVRITAALLMLGSIAMVFVSAFVLGLDILVISASPRARRTLTRRSFRHHECANRL